MDNHLKRKEKEKTNKQMDDLFIQQHISCYDYDIMTFVRFLSILFIRMSSITISIDT